MRHRHNHAWPEQIPPSRTAHQKCLHCDVVRVGWPKHSPNKVHNRHAFTWLYRFSIAPFVIVAPTKNVREVESFKPPPCRRKTGTK